MGSRSIGLLLSLFLLAHPAVGQPVGSDTGELTEAELEVREIIEADGVHVVHFWAPWCANSLTELENGWKDLILDNEDVSFTFVTIWNNGRDGKEKLRYYGIPERVREITQPDHGASIKLSNRRRTFLGLPVTWVPSTWIFHKNGRLAFAMNYGEMTMDLIQQLLDTAKVDSAAH